MTSDDYNYTDQDEKLKKVVDREGVEPSSAIVLVLVIHKLSYLFSPDNKDSHLFPPTLGNLEFPPHTTRVTILGIGKVR